jgi:prepilin-type N-terminal cleavage/methylation domain-containing protein
MFARVNQVRFRLMRGFTLMELLLVMAIITILVSVVAPSLRGFMMGRANNNAAVRIMSMARFARAQAISQGCDYRLNVDPSGRAFWVTAQTNGQFTNTGSDLGDRYQLPDGVTLDTDIPQRPDGQYITFNSSGRSETAQVRLTDTLGKTVTVACSSPTELFRVVPVGATP